MMNKIFQMFAIVIFTLVICSCGLPTVKYNNSYTRNEILQDYVTIKIHRADDIQGFGANIGIQDGNKDIGELGRGGDLTWRRPAGYVAIIESIIWLSIEPVRVIIFRAEAGKTYSFNTNVSSWPPPLDADNPKETDILYNESATDAKDYYNKDKGISDKWKAELVRLKYLENENTKVK